MDGRINAYVKTAGSGRVGGGFSMEEVEMLFVSLRGANCRF